MKAGAYIAVILAVLVGAGFYIFYGGESAEDQEILLTSQAEHFIQTIESETIARVGQPIEGFEPSMFMLAFPGIIPSDFNGVESQQGIYQVSNGAIAFVLTDSGPEHSASRAITPSGMKTLLENISVRLNIAPDTIEGIEDIFTEISAIDLGVIEESIVGVWQSVDDENFVREFKEDGTVIDTYEEDEDATLVGQWFVLTDLSEEPPTVPSIEGATYLKILFAEEALYFSISQVGEQALQLIYLDRGGALTFERIER